MNKRLRTILQVIVFFGVGSIILYFVYQRQNELYQEKCALDGIAPGDCSLLNKLWTDITGADPWILLIILAMFMVSSISRAIRWQILLEPTFQGGQDRDVRGSPDQTLGFAFR